MDPRVLAGVYAFSEYMEMNFHLSLLLLHLQKTLVRALDTAHLLKLLGPLRELKAEVANCRPSRNSRTIGHVPVWAPGPSRFPHSHATWLLPPLSRSKMKRIKNLKEGFPSPPSKHVGLQTTKHSTKSQIGEAPPPPSTPYYFLFMRSLSHQRQWETKLLRGPHQEEEILLLPPSGKLYSTTWRLSRTWQKINPVPIYKYRFVVKNPTEMLTGLEGYKIRYYVFCFWEDKVSESPSGKFWSTSPNKKFVRTHNHGFRNQGYPQCKIGKLDLAPYCRLDSSSVGWRRYLELIEFRILLGTEVTPPTKPARSTMLPIFSSRPFP